MTLYKRFIYVLPPSPSFSTIELALASFYLRNLDFGQLTNLVKQRTYNKNRLENCSLLVYLNTSLKWLGLAFDLTCSQLLQDLLHIFAVLFTSIILLVPN